MPVKAVAQRKISPFAASSAAFSVATDAANLNADKPTNGFVYTGKDYNGKSLKNVRVPFQTEEEARRLLKTAGITVEKLAPASEMFAFLNFSKKRKPSVKDMASLADQLAAQKATGITWDKITGILARVHPKEQVRAALHSVSLLVTDGVPPDIAFGAQVDKKGKPFFPSQFVYAFQIAEEIAAMPDPETGVSADAPVVMLRFFAQSQRKIAATIKALFSGLIGPTAIFAVCLVVFFFEVFFIVPQFAEIFVGLLQGKDTSLPLPTQIMLDISDFFYSIYGVIALILAAGIFGGGGYYYTKTEKGIEQRGRMLLKIPIVKSFFLPFYGSVFMRNFAIMTADQNVHRRFEILAQTSDNPAYKELSEHCRETLLNESPTLPQIFNGHLHLLGDMFAPVIETIDQNPGQSQVLLYSYSKQLQEEADEKLAVLISVISNVVYFMAAGMVFFILIASYAPLITMIGRLAGGSK
ncbi:MAG: hypothetical protein LH472_04805 [Pyrinomonadaceae bacterium]|nr:hypothetical protein [Pyrinomonadaceae bacterium]